MIKTMALFLFVVGVFIFGISYHNVDLAFNANYGLVDINGMGYVQDIPTMHLNGMMGFGISAMMLIGGFTLLFGLKERETETKVRL